MTDEQVIREGLVVYAVLYWLFALLLVGLLFLAARPLFSGRPRAAAARTAVLLAVTGFPAPVAVFPVPLNAGLAVALLAAGFGLWRARGRWPWVLFVPSAGLALVRDLLLVADVMRDPGLLHGLLDMFTGVATLNAETTFTLFIGVYVHIAILVLLLRLGLSALGIAAAWRARVGAAALVAGLMVLAVAVPDAVRAGPAVDRIEVDKSDRIMRLYAGEDMVREYHVALGGEPVGAKVRQGDQRTPEGRYVISGRNPASRFHLSLRISYPDARDKAKARDAGVSPGGDIMIHGLPNGWGWIGRLHRTIDWTDGCIAVADGEIEEIWELTPDGTPILIRP